MKQFAKSVGYAKQRGIALFFALIALLAISLAAVALIRSVDTSTLIAGNLAFKQSATTSGDAGVEAAMSWMSTIETANAGLSVLTQTAHPFNNTGGVAGALNPGYYSNLNPALSLTDGTGIQWNTNDSCGTGPNCADAVDPSGNTTRYIIQRMCRNANQLVPAANCLFSGAALDNGGHATPLPQNVCIGEGCPSSGQAPQNRITSRTTGPRNTVSYIQAFVY
jgi:Tfp pilus assembly protein PilX